MSNYIIEDIFNKLNITSTSTVKVPCHKIIFENDLKKIKWTDLSKDIKFKKIKEYLFNNNLNIRITDYKFNNIKYDMITQSIKHIDLIKK